MNGCLPLVTRSDDAGEMVTDPRAVWAVSRIVTVPLFTADVTAVPPLVVSSADRPSVHDPLVPTASSVTVAIVRSPVRSAPDAVQLSRRVPVPTSE